MKAFKKRLTCILALSLTLTMLAGCGSSKNSTAGEDNGASLYKAGVYEAEADGLNGPVKLKIELTSDSIKKVEVVSHKETPGISDGAIEKLPAQIVEGQTLALDVVSGASFTSKAILSAAEKALTEAGADIAKLKEKAETTL